MLGFGLGQCDIATPDAQLGEFPLDHSTRPRVKRDTAEEKYHASAHKPGRRCFLAPPPPHFQTADDRRKLHRARENGRVPAHPALLRALGLTTMSACGMHTPFARPPSQQYLPHGPRGLYAPFVLLWPHIPLGPPGTLPVGTPPLAPTHPLLRTRQQRSQLCVLYNLGANIGFLYPPPYQYNPKGPWARCFFQFTGRRWVPAPFYEKSSGR